MKLKHILTLLGVSFSLAAVGAVGVAAGEKWAEKDENLVAEVKADNAETTVRCAIDDATLSTYTLKFNAKLQGDKADSQSLWANGVMTDSGETFGGVKVYSATFTATYDGASKLQFQLWNGESFVGGKYAFGGDGDWNHSWTSSSTISANILVYSNGSWEEYVPQIHTFGLYGDRNGWASSFGTFDDEEMTITADLNLYEKFKIVRDDTDWYGYNSVSNPSIYLSGEGGNDIEVKMTGTYVFTIPANFSGTGITVSTTPVVSNGAYLRGDWTDGWEIDGQIAMTSSSADGPYTATGVNLSAGCAVKALYINNGTTTWAQFNSVSSTDPDHYPVIEVDDGMGGKNAGVQSTGTYNITVTKNGSKWDYVFEGTANEDLDAATTFANNFRTAMYTNCSYNYSEGDYNEGENHGPSYVVSAWQAQMTTYAGLDSTVTAYLTDKDSKITAITNFFEVYDYVYLNVTGVSSIVGADFLGRTPSAGSVTSITGNTIISNNNGFVIITIIAITTLAIGGVVIIRKRKQEN